MFSVARNVDKVRMGGDRAENTDDILEKYRTPNKQTSNGSSTASEW